jgi:hypothetical protein
MELGWGNSSRQSSVFSRRSSVFSRQSSVVGLQRINSNNPLSQTLIVFIRHRRGDSRLLQLFIYITGSIRLGVAMSGSYREIKAWQKSIEFVVAIYSCTRGFPGDELYGLTSQLRRAAVSIPSNIAEGKVPQG